MPSSNTYVGYGESPYSLGSWGLDLITVSVDGVSSEGSVGAVTVVLKANIYPTGVEGVSGLGNEFVSVDVEVDLTGVQASGELGQLPRLLGWGIGPWGEGAWGIGNANIFVSVTGVDALSLIHI